MVRNIETREGYEFWDRLNRIPKYAFLLSPAGNSVQKVRDVGDWIDRHEAQVVMDDAQSEINELREQNAALEDEAQALREEVAALRARVAVFPDFDNDVIIDTFRRNGFLIELGASYSVKGQIAQLLNALEELARLNGKAVSEGLLHETVRSVDDIFWAIHAKPSCQSGVVARCRCRLCAGTRLAMARDDLNALLGEVNEHE